MLLNRDRANMIMDLYELDALILREKQNVYYFTDYTESLSEGGWPFASLAILPRNESIPPTLIIPSISLQTLDRESPSWVKNIIAYSDYSGRHFQNQNNKKNYDEPAAAVYEGWPTRSDSELSYLEKVWSQRRDDYRSKVAASPAWALFRSINESGLQKSRIGTDDLRLTNWLYEMGHKNIKAVDALNIIREIRLIKTSKEIQIMKQAAVINETSTLKAIDSINEGGLWSDIRTNYASHIASLGGRMRYLNTYLGGLPKERVVLDEPFFIDALGEYKHYLADFGRTVVVGNPTDELIERMSCLESGFRSGLEILKPGVKKSEIVKKIVQTVNKLGFKDFFNVTPHSLGLEHTDNPILFGPNVHDGIHDFKLEENMIINIDMPHVEYGWGSIHIEDTLLITKDGYEGLTSLDTKLIIKTN